MRNGDLEEWRCRDSLREPDWRTKPVCNQTQLMTCHIKLMKYNESRQHSADKGDENHDSKSRQDLEKREGVFRDAG